MLGLETLKETINIAYKISDVMMKTIIDLHLPTDVEIQIMKEITEFISTHAPDEVVEIWKEKLIGINNFTCQIFVVYMTPLTCKLITF